MPPWFSCGVITNNGKNNNTFTDLGLALDAVSLTEN